jgi:uncharacterized protein (TIGR03437 family)
VSEQAGVGSTLTDLLIDGESYASQIAGFFGSPNLPARGFISASLGVRELAVPLTRTYVLKGVDANGNNWSSTITARFVGRAPVPAIDGATNGASFQQSYAPGMILSVFGSNLTTTSPQAAAVVPLSTSLGGMQATINGVFCPLYYVSPQQVNLQVPYETQTGTATLLLTNGLRTSSFSLRIVEAAPGIFVGGDGATVPFASGSRGQASVLFITGEGLVTPTLATGAAPPLTTPISNLPKPRLPVKLTIGGVEAQIAFAGIPYGLAGVTQINFTVPDAAPLGKQQIVVTVGDVPSAAASFTVNP